MYKFLLLASLTLFPFCVLADDNSGVAVEFTKACVQLDPVALNLTQYGNNGKIACQTKDGGNVNITMLGFEGVFKIHQTKQMDGKAISALVDAARLNFYLGDTNRPPMFYLEGDRITPEIEKVRYQCATKIKEARDSGTYGDLVIKFSEPYVASCAALINQ